MNLLAWLGSRLPYIDITPDPDTLAELDAPAACDKHRELLNDAAIVEAQRRIIAKGGTVSVTPQDHAARLKGRK